MRLLRIKSQVDQNTGHFSNNFKTPVKIEPFSQIALVNAVLALDSRLMTVSSSNNTMSFTRKNNGSVSSVVIPIGSYSTKSFLTTFSTALNSGSRPDTNKV